MAKKETQTDLWVYDLLKIAGLKLSAQGSDIIEIDNALKTASKSKTGKVGRPEYCGVVKDFLVVIEDKADIANHSKLNDNTLICNETVSVRDFAVNGALHYGLHLAHNTSYKKIIAIGVSGKNAIESLLFLLMNVVIISNLMMWKHSRYSMKKILKNTILKISLKKIPQKKEQLLKF